MTSTTDHDITFGKITGELFECSFCGISSFSHIHRKGTKPNEFERIPEAPLYIPPHDVVPTSITLLTLQRLRERVRQFDRCEHLDDILILLDDELKKL